MAKKLNNKNKNLDCETNTRKTSIDKDKFIDFALNEISFYRDIKNDFENECLPNVQNKLNKLEETIYNLFVEYIEIENGSAKAEVAVVGDFSGGKSTFINSLLGKSVCPMDTAPTTSSVTKFYYSPNEVITKNGELIQKDKYYDLVKHKNLGHQTDVFFFEYGYPFESFSNITLYDTPGFGNSQNIYDEQVTENILKIVDIVLYMVDIQKGSLTKEAVERLSKIKDDHDKNKKFFCILNKADLKAQEAVEQIRKEIESFHIFDAVIPYSSKEVLSMQEENELEHICHTALEQKIEREETFSLHIKGEVRVGRRNKKKYEVKVDDKLISIPKMIYIKQKREIENVLQEIATKKEIYLKSAFTHKLKKYRYDSINDLESLKSEIGIEQIDTSKEEWFNDVINDARKSMKVIERENVRIVKRGIINAFREAMEPTNVTNKKEKSYVSTPYAKVYMNTNKFFSALKKSDFLDHVQNNITKTIEFFDEKYGITLQNNHDAYVKYFVQTVLEGIKISKKYKCCCCEDVYPEIPLKIMLQHGAYIPGKKNRIFYFYELKEAKKFKEEFIDEVNKALRTDMLLKYSYVDYFFDINHKEIEQKRKEMYAEHTMNKHSKYGLVKKINQRLEEKKTEGEL
jgi:small GTP-binding protein